MNKHFLLLPLLGLAGCIAADQEEFSTLRPGRWIEAKGQLVNGEPVVEEIDELERSESDKVDKVDIDASTESASPTDIGLLGMVLPIDSETEFETRDKETVDPFVPKQGDWLTVKLRWKEEDNSFRVRTVRQGEPRTQFQVEGEVTAYNPLREQLAVGGITMKVKQDADIKMLGDRDADDPLAMFQADEQKAVPFSLRIGDNLILGGQTSFGLEFEDEYDLDRLQQQDRTKLDLEAKIAGIYLFGDSGSYVLFEANAARADRFENERGKPDTTREEVKLARLLTSVAVNKNLQVLVGRQDWDEEREWLYDEVLDGVRVLWRQGDFRYEISGAVGSDWATPFNDIEDTKLVTAFVRYHIDSDWTLGAYALKRFDSSEKDHEPLLFGVRSIANNRYGLSHWAELGFARGHTADVYTSGPHEDIDGYAFDIGGLYTVDSPWRPTFGLGYALGSGRRDSADGFGYRQSGYQDNNAKMGGVTSVRYYGELLRPELANLAVVTASAAIRPWRNASFSVLFHHYLQDYAAQHGPLVELKDSSGSRPNGRNPELGYEVDLVFGLRVARRLSLELVGAHFVPGSAFDNQDSASKLDLSVRLSF